jgi:lipid A ethanolaminephosphotransferase
MSTGKKKASSPSLSVNQLLLVTSVYFTLVINYPFVSGFNKAILALEEFNLLFLVSVPFFLGALIVLLFSFFSIKHLVKPFIIITLLISSLVFYGSIQYGIVFDYGMIQNSIETNSTEAFSYLCLELIGYFITFGLLPSFFVYKTTINYRPLLQEALSRIKLMTSALLTILLIAFFFYQDYAAVGRNNSHLKKFIIPSQYLSSGFKYIKYNYIDEDFQFTILDESPSDNEPRAKEVVVLVVGETARAVNFSANGYEKATNSHTQKFKPTSFKKMFSCGTSTAISVPCMFSSLTRENFDRKKADHQQNLLDVVSLAGVDVLWIDNNGCKAVCNRVPTITLNVDQDNPLCDGEYCQDEVLLTPLRHKLANLSKNKTFIILHMMGSHGPTYFKRYPSAQKKFIPDCHRSDIQNCSSEELTNTYDNTIAYTDFVLSQVIEQLNVLPDDINRSMIYVSDHGESLGESGAYLHGFPYVFAPKEQRHIPMFLWMSAQNQDSKTTKDCLNQLAENQHYSHDNLYHSMLGLLAINSSTYEKTLDIFSTCPRSNFNKKNMIAKIGKKNDL